MFPSSALLARFESEAAELAGRAADQNASAEMIDGRVATLKYTQVQESQQLAAEIAAVEKLRAEIAERQQHIDDGEKRAQAHRASAEAMQADADYLIGQVRAVPGVPEVPGPQVAAPATPTEAASNGTPECLTCHGEIRQDSVGWHHASTRTGYCYEGSDASVMVVPAELAFQVNA